MRVLSLFSGVGGFDMGLEGAGMTTVFQCEIDKHARTVLDHHWPTVPKWDDVTTLTGAYILEQTGGVDVVAWGSPCQDLSLAGKRAGLSGERSGLFHHGIRIIKELRELSNGRYPTWSIWENVVGALSSNGGADFGEVLHEMDEAGACFSEWVVLDAQYFGVPQRRRRVFVTSCFDSSTSERCGSPLFPVSESLRGDSAKGKSKGEAVASEVAESTGTGSATFAKSRRAQSVEDHETWVESDVTPTLNVFDVGDTRATTAIVEPVAYPIDTRNALRDPEKRDAVNRQGLGVGEDGDPSPTLTHVFIPAVAYSIREDAKANNFSATEVETARALQALQPSVQSHHAQTFITQPILLDGRRVDDVRVYSEPVQTLQERMGTGGNNVPVVAQEPIVFQPGTMIRLNGGVWEGGPAPTLRAYGKSGDNEPHVAQEEGYTATSFAKYVEGVGTLKANGGDLGGGSETIVVSQEPQAISYDGYNQKVEEEIHRPWRIGQDSGDFIADLREPNLIVRRLTPLECERLMGWPDNHTSIGTNGPISDTQRYKMCGNGVASPVAQWLAKHLLNTTRSDTE